MNRAVNLIPASVLAARARRRRLRAWIVLDTAVAAALGTALGLAHPEASGLVDRLRSEHDAARATLATAQERLASTVAGLRQARAAEAVAMRLGARPDFSGLLRTIALELDERATLDHVLIAPLAPETDPQAEPAAPARPDAQQVFDQAMAIAQGSPATQDEPTPPPPPVREQYNVLITGMATSAGVASEFVLRLERTGYFDSVAMTSAPGRLVGSVQAVDFRITAVLGEGRLARADEEHP